MTPPPSIPGAVVPPTHDSVRLAKAMERWRRRSQVIHFWRRALPALMLLIGGGVLALVVANTLLSASRIADQDRQVRMLSPKFLGEDKGGRPYTVTAKDAVRDPAHMERITLNHPHLVLQSLNGDPPTIVDSILGLYNENSHMLALDGQVWLDDGKKDLFQSEHALVNTDAGTVDGRSPVVATGPIGRTTADTYRILDRGADVHFDGDVKSHLVNQ